MARIAVLCAGLLVAQITWAQSQLPDPTIINSTPEISIEWVVGLVFDNDLNTDFASGGAGTNTFIEFDFGADTLISQVSFTDRRSSGAGNGSGVMGPNDNVTAFDLTFSDDPVFGDAGDVVVSASSAPCCDTVLVNIPSGTSARYVRWDVTAISGAANNNGAAEFNFLGGPPLPVPGLGLVGRWVLLTTLLMAGLVTVRRYT